MTKRLLWNRFGFRVTDEMLNDLRARLRRRDGQTTGMTGNRAPSWNGSQRLVSYWIHEFDWRAWSEDARSTTFTWEGIHFVRQRAASGRGIPLILTHGWLAVSSTIWTCR
jgi:hypothetical protein